MRRRSINWNLTWLASAGDKRSRNIWHGRSSSWLVVAKSSRRQSKWSVTSERSSVKRCRDANSDCGYLMVSLTPTRRGPPATGSGIARPEDVLRRRQECHGGCGRGRRRKSGAPQCNCVVVWGMPFATSNGTTSRYDPHFVFYASLKPPWTRTLHEIEAAPSVHGSQGS